MIRNTFKLIKLCSLISLGMFLFGCAHYAMNQNYTGPKPLPEHIREEFSYPRNHMPYQEKIIETTDHFTVKQITFPSQKTILPKQHDIFIRYYDLPGNQKTPVIMVLPILGGSYRIAKIFASYFSENGYASMIVHRNEERKILKNIEDIDAHLKQMVLDLKQVIDWIETQEDLDSQNIGVFGISMGGIKSSLISALDERVRASVIALAAGDIPYLLTHSNEKGIMRKKKEFMQDKNLSPDELYDTLEKRIKCDPMNYAEYINANNILMILAIFDKTVPYSKGKELRDRIGKPETIFLFSGHYSSYLYLFYIKRESLQFFREKFAKR